MNNKWYVLLVLFLVVVVVMVACGGNQGGDTPEATRVVEEPGVTEEVVEEPTIEVIEEPTEEVGETPEVPRGNLCAEDEEPTGVPAFQEPMPQDTPNDGLRYVSVGSFTNDLSQTFTITVTGRLTRTVVEYISNLRLCLEVIPREGPVAEPPGEQTEPVESLADSLLREADSQNLIIEIIADLNAEQTEEVQTGYIEIFNIDPSVALNVTHDYPRKCRYSASAKIWMVSGEGSVVGNLYQNGTSTGATTVTAPNSTSLPAPGFISGKETYDLAVKGNSSSNNKYRVSGTWTYGYNATAPTGGGTACP